MLPKTQTAVSGLCRNSVNNPPFGCRSTTNQAITNQLADESHTHTHTPGDEYLGIGMAHLGVTLGPPAADRTVAVHFERPSCYPNLRSGKAASARKESNLLDTNLTRNTSFHHLLTPLFSSQTPLTEKHVSNI